LHLSNPEVLKQRSRCWEAPSVMKIVDQALFLCKSLSANGRAQDGLFARSTVLMPECNYRVKK
jgi:hypothetical protein